MGDRTKLAILALIFLAIGGGGVLFLFTDVNIAVLNPKGWIGEKQRDLIWISTALMLLIVIPVYLMTFGIAWRYRSSRKEAHYRPDWDYNLAAEIVWWSIPFVIMAALGVINWKACHELDPFRPIERDRKPLTIQVVALQWKWLFIYPEQGVAAVNRIQIPENTPIVFEISAQSPMNSFWIPDLGGQIYAMPGMRSKLHLIANGPGEYLGSSANISGAGFSSMFFKVVSSSEEDFDQWIESVRQSPLMLTSDEFQNLAKPSQYVPETFYGMSEQGLFEQIVNQYMPNP